MWRAAGLAALALFCHNDCAHNDTRGVSPNAGSETRYGLSPNSTSARHRGTVIGQLSQLGSLAGSLGVAAVIAASGRRQLAARIAVASATTWAAAKIVKQFVRRGRPGDTLEQVRVLGRDAAGLGYPSGHAAVALT